MALFFEWDEAKNIANERKHGIRFEDAASVFRDPLHRTVVDPGDHEEERWRTFGLVDGRALVMVVHLNRDDFGDEVIRIISARIATRKERKDYEGQDY